MKFTSIPMLASVLLSIATVSKAEVRCDLRFQHVVIIGNISESEIPPLEECLATLQHRPRVLLNSQGGDMHAAMSMGRLLRKAKAWAQACPSCSSSCVLLLAGAVERSAISPSVGIHRPYSAQTGTVDYSKAQIDFVKLQSDIRAYLNEMNLPTDLFDAMLQVPSEQVRYLTDKELTDYGLNSTDPVFADVEDSQRAGEIGISKHEFLTRKAEAGRQCKRNYEYDRSIPIEVNEKMSKQAIEEELDCTNSIYWGLSLLEYRNRIERATKICKARLNWESISRKRKIRGDWILNRAILKIYVMASKRRAHYMMLLTM